MKQMKDGAEELMNIIENFPESIKKIVIFNLDKHEKKKVIQLLQLLEILEKEECKVYIYPDDFFPSIEVHYQMMSWNERTGKIASLIIHKLSYMI